MFYCQDVVENIVAKGGGVSTNEKMVKNLGNNLLHQNLCFLKHYY
jgi:hypothetical protein